MPCAPPCAARHDVDYALPAADMSRRHDAVAAIIVAYMPLMMPPL